MSLPFEPAVGAAKGELLKASCCCPVEFCELDVEAEVVFEDVAFKTEAKGLPAN